MFTDGSSAAEGLNPSVMAKVEGRKGYARGGAAAVWLGSQGEWRSQLPRFLRVVQKSSPLSSYLVTPYAAELLPASLVPSLSTKFAQGLTMVSDCKAVTNRLKDSMLQIRRPYGHLAKGMILESIAVRREVPSLKVEWTRSHPERRKTDRQEWTFRDWGIYLADAVAAGHWHKVDQVMSGQPYLREEVDLDRAMEYAVSGGVWHWRDTGGSVTMDSLMDIAQLNYLQEYLNTRDSKYRAAEGRPPYWTGTNVAFSHACWKGRPKALRVAKKFTSLIYNKSYTSGYVRSHGKTGQAQYDAAICLKCGVEDTQAHMFLTCRCPETAFQRSVAKFEQTKVLNSIDTSATSRLGRIIARFVRLCWDDTNPMVERFWLGTHDAHSIEVLFGDGAEEVMSTEEFERIERALMQLTGPLLRVAMDIQTQRGAAFFGVKLRRTNSGRLRPRPVRVKVRIDERQIGIRRYLRLRVPSRGEGGGTGSGAARYVSGIDRINVRGRDRNREAKTRRRRKLGRLGKVRTTKGG